MLRGGDHGFAHSRRPNGPVTRPPPAGSGNSLTRRTAFDIVRPSMSLRGQRATMLSALAVVLVTAAVFFPVLFADFLFWDDNHNVVHNPHIKQLSFADLKWMFFEVGLDIRYKPLGYLAWALVDFAFGPGPGGYHAANLSLHLLNSVLVFVLLMRVLQIAARPGAEATLNSRRLVITAAGAALFWSVNPVRVEPIAWISCLPHHLSLMFVLLSLLCYLHADFERNLFPQGRFWASAVLFVFALLTFPIPMTFVAVVAAANIYPLRRIRADCWDGVAGRRARQVWLELTPFLAAGVASLALQLHGRYVLQGHMETPVSLVDFTVFDRLAQASYSWARYLWIQLLPLHLTPVSPDLLEFSPTDTPMVLSGVWVAAVSMLVIRGREKYPGWLAFWIAHIGLTLPVAGLTEAPHYAADRYTIIDGVLLAAAVAVSLWKLAGERGSRLPSVGMIAVLLMFSLRVRDYLPVWLDDVHFFQYLKKSSPNTAPKEIFVARLGGAYVHRRRWAEAEQEFRELLVLTGGRFDRLSLINRAKALEGLGNINGAGQLFYAALRVIPGDIERWHYLGGMYFKDGRIREAITVGDEALNHNPNSIATYRFFATALLERSLIEEAERILGRGLRHQPESGELHRLMGRVMELRGKPAVAEYHRALADRLSAASGSGSVFPP